MRSRGQVRNRLLDELFVCGGEPVIAQVDGFDPAACLAFEVLHFAVLVDADEGVQSELRVGIRSITRQPGAPPRVQVYLADTLANGAGYARHLGEPNVLNELLRDIIGGEASRTLEGMREHFRDPERCGTSGSRWAISPACNLRLSMWP